MIDMVVHRQQLRETLSRVVAPVCDEALASACRAAIAARVITGNRPAHRGRDPRMNFGIGSDVILERLLFPCIPRR